MWHFSLCLLLFAGAARFGVDSEVGVGISAVNAEPESICNHCFCQKTTAICNFKHNHTLSARWDNSTYFIPSTIKGLDLELTDYTRFQLVDGIFNKNNRVNRFKVIGTHHEDQVELTPHAFRNNKGGFPEINILGVQHVFIREQAFSDGEHKLLVNNSDILKVYKNAFVNVKGRCTFTNIRDLLIEDKAFSLNSFVGLEIANSNISDINSFVVAMNKIGFIDCNIKTVKSNAFDVTNVNELFFENCNIKKIETHAFTSKLLSQHVSIKGTQIGTIEGEAIMGSGISNLTLLHNTIDDIKENAIQVHSVYVYIEHNKINKHGKNWLHVVNTGDAGGLIARIEGNRFANFAPIQLESRRSNCTFANNWLGNPQASSLNFSNCKVRAISLDRECNCSDSQDWMTTLTDHDLSTELYCQLNERLRNCFNATAVHLRRYENEACGINQTTLQCYDSRTLVRYKGQFYSKEEREEAQRGTTLVHIILFGFAICIVGALLAVIMIRCAFKCRKSHPSEDRCSLSSENRRILQANAPRELEKHIQKLVSGKLTKRQCEKTIMEVLHRGGLPPEANQVITDHFHQVHGRSKNECYSAPINTHAVHHHSTEPTAPSAQENFYEELLIPNEYSAPSDPLDPNAVNDYSEPFNSASKYGYAEALEPTVPILPDLPARPAYYDVNDMPPAYEAMPQYATPLRTHPLPPSKQQVPPPPSSSSSSSMRRIAGQHQELPDVLYRRHGPRGTPSSVSYATPVWRSTPSATPICVQAPELPAMSPQRHVRDLRQDLEARPQFHPNQLTSARNQSQLQSRFASTPRPTNGGSSGGNGGRGGAAGGGGSHSNTLQRSYECLDGADTLAVMEHMDMRGAAALPPDSGSDHSGGSDETVKIDDVIEYADA